MKINEVEGKLTEGYKLSYHEIMALFDVIEQGRYMPTDKIEDKAKQAANKVSSAANKVSSAATATKNAAANAASSVKSTASNASSAMYNAAKRFNKYSPSKNRSSSNNRVEPTLNDSIIYEGNFGDMVSGAKDWAKREIIKKKPIISASALTKMWTELGRPTDSDEIVRMLIHDVKMPKNMVLNAMKTAADRDPNVVAFANLVKDQGLTSQVLAACDAIIKSNNISNKQGNRLDANSRLNKRNNQRRSFGDSVEHDGHIISEELTISDADVRKIVTQAAMKKVGNGTSVAGTEKYVKDWANKIKSQTDAVSKMKLVKEIVNFLADVHGTDEWKKVVHGVDSIIKNDKTIAQFTKDSQDKNDDNFVSIVTTSLANGKTMERKIFLITNDILAEADMKWSDLSLKPVNNSGKITIYETIAGTNTPVKQFITEMAINNIKKQIATIGRIKKI